MTRAVALVFALTVPIVLPRAAAADEPSKADDQHFKVDPVADATLMALGLGTAGLEELVLSTGEITPQRPGDPTKLLSIDRIAVTQTIDPNAATVSNIGLGLALSFAVI